MVSNFVNKLPILAIEQRKTLKNMTGDYLWLCFIFLYFFGYLFSLAGRDGYFLFVVWLLALVCIIHLFKCALNAADGGL